MPVDERCNRRYDWAAVQAYYDAGHTLRACRAAFGFSSSSWHPAVKRGAITPRPRRTPIEDLLVVGRQPPTNRVHLRNRLIAEGLKEDRCERCGISEWQGLKLSLELHHRNGQKHDNRLENLEILCGNCHSLTHTWGGRNVARKRHLRVVTDADGPNRPGRKRRPPTRTPPEEIPANARA